MLDTTAVTIEEAPAVEVDTWSMVDEAKAMTAMGIYLEAHGDKARACEFYRHALRLTGVLLGD